MKNKIYFQKFLSEGDFEYMLLPEYWGKGYGNEIERELLKKAEEISVYNKLQE